MADYSIPLQVQTPQPLSGLNNILGVAQAAQGLKLQSIDLQQQQQANTERQAVLPLMKQFMQPDGTFDTAAAGPAIMAVAPQTGVKWLSQLADTNTRVAQANGAQLKLSQEQNQQVAQGLTDLVGKPKSEVIDGVSQLVDQYPQLKGRAAILSQNLSHVDDNSPQAQQAVNAILQHHIDATQTLAQRKELETPSTVSQNVIATDAQGNPVPATTLKSLSPEWATGVPRGTSIPGTTAQAPIGPGEIERTEVDPVSKQAVIVRRDAGGNIVSSRPASSAGGGTAPGGPSAFTNVPPGETVDTMNQLQQNRAASNQTAARAGELASNNQQILQLLKQGTTTGSNANFVRQVFGSVGLQWTNDEAANLDKISHFLALQTQANEKAMGVNTDAGRETSQLASGGIPMTTEGLRSATKANDAVVSAMRPFNTGLEASIQKGGIGAARTFQNQWSANFDPIIYRYANAIRDGDSVEQARIEKQYGKPANGKPILQNSPWGQLVAKMHNLDVLENQGAQQ